jgi:hypothetical protein
LICVDLKICKVQGRFFFNRIPCFSHKYRENILLIFTIIKLHDQFNCLRETVTNSFKIQVQIISLWPVDKSKRRSNTSTDIIRNRQRQSDQTRAQNRSDQAHVKFAKSHVDLTPPPSSEGTRSHV